MNTKHYKLAVYIGRFQPFHIGHGHAIKEALRIADKVLVLVGSSNRALSTKNPFTVEERIEMVDRSFPNDRSRLEIRPLPDSTEADWIANVQGYVDRLTASDDDVVLVGHEKDASSYYLKIFPQWDTKDLGYLQIGSGSKAIDATRIRMLMFENEWAFVKGAVNIQVSNFLETWKLDETFMRLQKEYEYIREYKRTWASAPYPPTFVTADAVVVQSGHVLVVERGQLPGKGLLALPGGFVGENERIVDAAIRELVEETGIKLQPEVLRRCIQDVRVFDSPTRSLRGRTITHAYLFRLDDTKPLPPIRGGDDAADAMWLPLSEVFTQPQQFFDDHHEIITTMIASTPAR